MKYLVNNPFLLTFLKTCDAFLPKAASKKIDNPKKLLLANLAHLGDLVVSTGVIESLKEAYPHLEIGFVLGSWSREVIEGHPLVTHIHLFDHWKLNRSSLPFYRKILQHFETRRQALKEIKALGYDTAIDLYPYFPNAISLLSLASIPCRIGYISGGFGSLLTDPHPWCEKDQSMAQYQGDLLSFSQKPPSLLSDPFPLPHEYIVIHMGAGTPHKEQSVDLWKKILEYFSKKNCCVVLTGKGEKEHRNIQKLCKLYPYGINLCDQLTWKQLVALIQNAKLVISVDTVVMHIASFSQTPNFILAPHLQRMWKPDNSNSVVVNEDNIIKNIEEMNL